MLKRSNFNHYSTYLIAAEAERRGVKVKKMFSSGVFAKHSLVELQYKKHFEVIVGQRINQTGSVAYWLTKNKQATKVLLEKNGIATAQGQTFRRRQADQALAYAKKIGFPVVVKPHDGIQGKMVFVGLNDAKQTAKAIKQVAARYAHFLVEKEFKGLEYRIFATREKFVAATHRIPANVLGDGNHNIKELIKIKNSDPRRGFDHGHALVGITVDDEVKRVLREQKLSLRSKPQVGQFVFLRRNSNLSTGGDSIDVTTAVHPAVKKLAVKTIRAIPGLAYAGIDFLTTDVTKAPKRGQYIIIELNDSPMVSMHHDPYQGKQRDAAGAIIDLLFPETKTKKK